MPVSYARLCASYVVACALLGDIVAIGDFRPEALAAPDRLALAARVALRVDANPDPNALAPVRVAVRLAGGTTHAIEVGEVYGSPARPMTRAAHLAKFRRNWRAGNPPLVAAAADALAARVDALDALADVTALVDLLVA
jgi:2-methylcitrate dehydratase PrpD